MRRLIKINKIGIARLKGIRDDIILNGKSHRCPMWNKFIDIKYKSNDKNVVTLLDVSISKWLDECRICRRLFPKVTLNICRSCPCCVYKPNYLIKRLNEIIEFNEKGK